MKKAIITLLIFSLFSPMVSGQEQPETPQWSIDWITDMSQPVEFTSSSPNSADSIWLSLEFYVENTRPTPVSVQLEFEWDEENTLEVTSPDTIDAAAFSNTTYMIDIRSTDSSLIETLSPNSPLSFSYSAQEVVNGQALMGQSQTIEGSVVMTSLHELALNVKWVNPVNAGSWSNSTIEIVNEGNSDDAAKEASLEISGCPQLSVTGEGEATGVVIGPSQAHTFDLKIEASSSHPEKQCQIHLTIKSEGDGESHTLVFHVDVKHPKDDGDNTNSPSPEEESDEESNLESDSSLSGFLVSELFFALMLLLLIRRE